MATYYIKLTTIPTRYNPVFATVAGAYACCWVVGEDTETAENVARFHVSKNEWTITGMETLSQVVTEDDYLDRDLALEQFRRAQEHGIAVFYSGWSRDGKTSAGPMLFEPPKNFNLNAYITRGKKLSQSGRCLHFNAGSDCSEYIQAHSIQRSGQLAAIAVDGHVYAVAKGIGALKKNNGRQTMERRGIGTVSTFLGFCSKHDTEIFRPIDTQLLNPTHEQAFLYAYRSICRELFVKENAVSLIEQQLREVPADSSNRSFYANFRAGFALGHHRLLSHKSIYDQALRTRDCSDLEYVVFRSSQKQTLAFSGLLLPEFDFHGRPLQDLSDISRPLDLITFCSAPMDNGWGFLFAWHRSSDRSCYALLNSLAEAMRKDVTFATDAMFRLVMCSCENLAASPLWWEGLDASQQSGVMDGLTEGTNLFSARDPDYLASGLEGISQWRFDAVEDSRN